MIVIDDGVTRRIASILRDDNERFIGEIAKQVGVHRLTAAKYLAVMEAKGYVEHRLIGRAKVFKLSSVGRDI